MSHLRFGAGLTRHGRLYKVGYVPAVDLNPIVASGATAWFDGHDGSGLQQITSRIGTGVVTLGSTSGVDTNDPTWGSNGWTFDATDDCMSSTADIPNVTPTTGKHTALIVFTTAVGASAAFWATGAATNQRFMIYRTGSNLAAYCRGTGTAVQATTAFTTTAGIKTAVGIIIDTGTMYCYVYQSGTGTMSAGTAITGVGTLTGLTNPAYGNTSPVTLINPLGGTMYAAVEWKNSAVDKSTLDTTAAYLLGTF